MNTIQTPQKYLPRLHLKLQLRLRPSVKFQMHILAPSDKRLPTHTLRFKPDTSISPQQFVLYPAYSIRTYRSNTTNSVIYKQLYTN